MKKMLRVECVDNRYICELEKCKKYIRTDGFIPNENLRYIVNDNGIFQSNMDGNNYEDIEKDNNGKMKLFRISEVLIRDPLFENINGNDKYFEWKTEIQFDEEILSTLSKKYPHLHFILFEICWNDHNWLTSTIWYSIYLNGKGGGGYKEEYVNLIEEKICRENLGEIKKYLFEERESIII